MKKTDRKKNSKTKIHIDNIYNKTKGHNITTNCKTYMSGDKLPPAISPICSQHLSEKKQRGSNRASDGPKNRRLSKQPTVVHRITKF